MRTLLFFILLSCSTPLWALPVLKITDAQRIRTVAPFASFYEDLTNQLTYDQVARFPIDSFKPVNRQGAIQMGIRLSGRVWLRVNVQNHTQGELYLMSSHWRYRTMQVYVLNEKGQLHTSEWHTQDHLSDRLVPIAQPVVSVGLRPHTLHISLSFAPHDYLNDFMQLTTMGQVVRYQKNTALWQGGLAGVYLLTFLFALAFFFRLRDPLIGWYALYVYISAHWFLDRSGYMLEFFDRDSWYTHFRSYYPIHLLLHGLWAIFVIKFIQLKKYSKFLYYLIFCWVGVDVADYFFSVLNQATILGDYYGQNYTPLRLFLHWLNLEYIGYAGVTFFFLLISIIYVSLKDFKTVRWYAVAFSIGLISMIIAILALYDISWLPFYPFNNLYFIGSLLEIILLGFILAQRANQHRKEQVTDPAATHCPTPRKPAPTK